MLSKKVLALLASFGFLLFLSVGFVSSCSINCECQGAGFDFGIEKFECNNNSPELNNLNYSINVEWALDGENECSGISWNSSPDVAGVLSKEDGLPLFIHSGGNSGSFIKSEKYAISHVTFCGLEGNQDKSVEIVAHKIVCDSEEYLPNWGGVQGLPSINESTAQDFINANSNHCWFEEGWNFQWAFNLSNPGDNVGYAANWNTFGPTNSQGKTSTIIHNAKNGLIKLREVFKEGYVQFSGYPPYNESLDEDFSAEFYCDGDVFHYDNYDYIVDPINGGETFYCVGFNALLEPPLDPPTCSVEYLQGVYGEGFYNLSSSNYINNVGTYEVYGFSSANDPNCKMDVVQYNRTSPNPYFVPSWKSSSKQTSNWSIWKTDVNDNSFIEGWHEICCLPTSQECGGEKCGDYITGDPSCKQFCIDSTAPEKVTNVLFSNKPQEICGNESVINYAPIFSWDVLEDEGCAPIHYEVNLFFSNGTLIENYSVEQNTSFEVPSEHLISGEDYYIEVRAVDEAGNEGEWSDASEHVWYDDEKPQYSLISPLEYTWFKDDFNVSINFTDNLGLYECKIRIKDTSTENETTINVDCKDYLEFIGTGEVPVGLNEVCSTLGNGTCKVWGYVKDLACNSYYQKYYYFSVDYQAPETTKTVGTPKINASDYPDLFQWIAKLINGFFINDKTTITMTCEDFNLSGCNETYYTIDFQPFYENETYGDWINVVTNKAYNNTPFTLNEGDGLYNITYWSVDNAGNVEEAKFEVDKVDLYAPKTSMIFTGLVINGLYFSDNFDFPVLMDFIRPSYDNEPIINLSATDSQVGVDKTWYQILVPSSETTNHVEGYINGEWFEESSEEFMECVVEKGCATVSFDLDEDDFVQNKGPQPEFDFHMTQNAESLSWKVKYKDSGITSSGLQLVFNNGTNVFQIAVNNNYPNGMIQMYPWNSNSPSTTLPSGVIINGFYGDSQIEIIVPLSILNEGNYDYAINAEVDWDASAGSIQNHYPSTWERWTTNGMASALEYSQCEEECGITYWKLSPQFLEMSCEEEWCEYNESQGIIFTEECDHKVCYYSEDRLGNKEEVQCTVFSIDGEGPLLALHNPSLSVANSIRTCSLNVLVESLDLKSGINDSIGVEAYLRNGIDEMIKLEKNPSFDGKGSTFFGDMYSGNFNLEGIPAGDYTLIIVTEDNLGNQENISRTVKLESGIFIDENWSPSCLIGGEGGLCELEFRACVRNSTSMDFSMTKIKPYLANVVDLNATLLTEGGQGMVGQLNDTLDGYESFPDEVQFSSESCEVINGRTSFIVSLNFTKELMETISNLEDDEVSNYKFDYEVNSYLDESCLVPQ